MPVFEAGLATAKSLALSQRPTHAREAWLFLAYKKEDPTKHAWRVSESFSSVIDHRVYFFRLYGA